MLRLVRRVSPPPTQAMGRSTVNGRDSRLPLLSQHPSVIGRRLVALKLELFLVNPQIGAATPSLTTQLAEALPTRRTEGADPVRMVVENPRRMLAQEFRQEVLIPTPFPPVLPNLEMSRPTVLMVGLEPEH